MPESIVEWKPRPRNRVFVRLSGGRFFTVPASQIQRLEAGTVLSDEEIEKLSRVDQYFRGQNKALRLLSIRPRSGWEIKKALDDMGLVAPVRDGVLTDLKEKGLVDDVRFARDFVRSQSELRHFGPHRLRFDLQRRGVAAAVIEEALNREITGESQREAAWAIANKRLAGRPADEREVRRIGAALRRKGIDYEIINQVMYQLLQGSKSSRLNKDD